MIEGLLVIGEDDEVGEELDPMALVQATLNCPYEGCNGTLPPITEGVGTQFCLVCDNPCYPVPNDGGFWTYVTDDEFTIRHDALCEK